MKMKNKMSPSDLAVTEDISTKVLKETEDKFLPKKVQSLYLADIYKYISVNSNIHTKIPKNKLMDKYKKVLSCGNYLEFAVNPNDWSDKRLSSAFFCKDRLCMMCNWRRTLKLAYQNSLVLNEAQKQGYQFLFVTLTVPNCNGENLSETCDKLMAGYRYLYHKNKRFKKMCNGSICSLEITYNPITQTYHPHIHLIIAVNKSYFKTADYVTQKELTEIWSEYMDMGKNLIVNIKKVKPDKNGSLYGSINEISKYAVKGSDFYMDGDIEKSAPVVAYLMDCLRKRRLINRTGILKKIHKDLNLDDVESDEANLINVDDSSLREDVVYTIVRLHWKYGCYIQE